MCFTTWEQERHRSVLSVPLLNTADNVQLLQYIQNLLTPVIVQTCFNLTWLQTAEDTFSNDTCLIVLI